VLIELHENELSLLIGDLLNLAHELGGGQGRVLRVRGDELAEALHGGGVVVVATVARRCAPARSGVAEAAHNSQTRPEIALAEIDSVIAAGPVFWMRAMPDTVSARRYVEAALEN